MLYSYVCDTCQKNCEIQKKLADYKRTEFCPECKAEMRRLISSSPVQFKGGGWAKDGYSNSYVTFKHKSGKSETVPYDSRKVKKGRDD